MIVALLILNISGGSYYVIKKKQLDSDDFSSRNRAQIKYIVIHDTGKYKDTDGGDAHYFCEGKRKSSDHYFVDEDSITKLVEDYN